MIYVAAAIAVLIGAGLIRMAFLEFKELSSEVKVLREHSAKKNRMKIMAEVVALEINTDFPFKLLDWPSESDFEDKEEYKKALGEAKLEYYESLNKIEVFGNCKVEYRYVAPDGDSYLSRTITRIPSDKNIDFINSLEIGQRIPAFLNPDDYGDSILKPTSKEQFDEYLKVVTRPQKAKMAVGSAVIAMGLVAPWTFTLLPS